jgi:SAM-dependent methyltransferase
MSHEGADWLERPDREETEQPDKVIDALKIPLGSTVADIGAGTGYFSLRIAQRIGPEGRVLATEIQPEMLRLLGENMRKAGIVNIDRILCTERDAKLPPGKVDLALMVDVYHELYEPEATVAQIRRALKSDGRLVLVEYRGEDPTVPIKPEHKMTLRQVRYEIEPMGFRLKEVFEFLIHQHVIVMVKDEAYGEVVVIDPDDFPHVRIPGGMLPTEDDFQAASFKPLLNGKDLAGWDGDRLTWTMRDGLIVGRKLDGQPGGSYLCTQENYQDFELDVQWRLRDPQGNSGVQFRSQRRPDNQFAGYMMDIAPGRHASVAEEGGRGRLEQSTDTANAVILPGEWNRYTIRCLGDQITVAVNGVETVRFNDPNGPRSGVVALEQDQGEVEFKEIWIKRLVNDGSDE